MTKQFRIYLNVAAVVLSLGLTCSAGAQQPPEKRPEAKPKAKRVWTNEDMGGLRGPADEYADKKAAEAEKQAQLQQKAEAGKTAPAKTAEQKPSQEPKDYLPKTVQEAEQRLPEKLAEIDDTEQLIARFRAELDQATTDVARQQLQKQIDQKTTNLGEAREELSAIRTRLEDLRANPNAYQKSASEKAAPTEAELAKAMEDTERQIAEKRGQIQSQTDYIEQLRSAVASADSETNRVSLQKKLDGFIALLAKSNAELKTLETQLQELKEKGEAPKPPAASQN